MKRRLCPPPGVQERAASAMARVLRCEYTHRVRGIVCEGDSLKLIINSPAARARTQLTADCPASWQAAAAQAGMPDTTRTIEARRIGEIRVRASSRFRRGGDHIEITPSGDSVMLRRRDLRSAFAAACRDVRRFALRFGIPLFQ